MQASSRPLVWYDVEDLWALRGMRETLPSYKSRICAQYARFIRHARPTISGPGRPKTRPVIEAEGLVAMGGIPPEMKPCPLPYRLTDRARSYLVGPGTFLLNDCKVDSEAMVKFGLNHPELRLVEPDFTPL